MITREDLLVNIYLEIFTIFREKSRLLNTKKEKPAL